MLLGNFMPAMGSAWMWTKQELQNRAYECRRLAAIMRDPNVKQNYLTAADTWETLAWQAEVAAFKSVVNAPDASDSAKASDTGEPRK